MIRLLLPALLLTAAACHPRIPLPEPPTACGSDNLGWFVGKKRTDKVSAEVARISQAKSIRWISPGMAVTMDFREDRLNVRLNDKGVILGFNCG